MQASVASLLGPAMPYFTSLRQIEGHWAGDGLQGTHLSCLQHAPLLEVIVLIYFGNVNLGPNFPEGNNRTLAPCATGAGIGSFYCHLNRVLCLSGGLSTSVAASL
jgi:hypothetical protein